MVRSCGDYPLLGGGDVNLYSLFVERATALIKPDGFVGLLTPSGIYADKTAAPFFKSLSTSGRVGGLFDFENRRLGTTLPPFFPDVDSPLQVLCPCLRRGGTALRPDRLRLLPPRHGDDRRRGPLLSAGPGRLRRVNPNTGTAPVFRTRRDAEITRGIYERHPVLVDRSGGEEVRGVAGEVRHHVPHDQRLAPLQDKGQLEAEGFYPVQGNRWRNVGRNCFFRLYEGKMVSSSSTTEPQVRSVVNPASTHNPYLSERGSRGEPHTTNIVIQPSCTPVHATGCQPPMYVKISTIQSLKWMLWPSKT